MEESDNFKCLFYTVHILEYFFLMRLSTYTPLKFRDNYILHFYLHYIYLKSLSTLLYWSCGFHAFVFLYC